ncbi:DNA replication/repair protein RecF [Anaerocolumna xylanovorans]|uniref:DNA replication and repair protein RecF n=1 Tax=Anaerocolumna xylanovorans DSM 12503 TaxID=1121345 RepID=A0A1M7YNP0_9FIRM|nr:DNA replication/repair protein RecF [Anaerocolumna xylanovorans]SHO54274.1 DNA replication and repair protein RecF [Anaerocolumna xylanovorans DSM 12503]
MFIKTLELKDYRNYENLSMDFSQGVNILYGDNAQGKTNILESLYMCGTTKSHRNSKDREIIKFEKEESHIRIILENKGISHKIDIHLKKNKAKGVAIDGIPIKKSSELLGIVNYVFFSPEDLGIIKNGPSERRRFLDMELCQLDKVYFYHLSNYHKIINQRNNLLKQISFNRKLLDTISVWDDQLVFHGIKVMEGRENFIRTLNPIVDSIHSNLSGKKESLTIHYEPNTDKNSFEETIKKFLERDIALKSTGTGPHRDDISFLNGTIDIRKFGSQGQQRTAALSLKLAEIEVVKRITKNQPILLLDDVLSELDRKRQNYLLNSIHDIQTIITCTGLEEMVQNRVQCDRIFKVTEGTVTSINFDKMDFTQKKTGGNV